MLLWNEKQRVQPKQIAIETAMPTKMEIEDKEEQISSSDESDLSTSDDEDEVQVPPNLIPSSDSLEEEEETIIDEPEPNFPEDSEEEIIDEPDPWDDSGDDQLQKEDVAPRKRQKYM